MNVAFLCCFLFLTGTAFASSVEATNIGLPHWSPDVIPDWVLDLLNNLPNSIQTIIDRLPDIIAAIPEVQHRFLETTEQIIDQIPKIIDTIIDKQPEILVQIPALIERGNEILRIIILRIPELIAVILEKIPKIIKTFPGTVERMREIYDIIKKILEESDMPDWFPTLPNLEKPDCWPDKLPKAFTEYNRPTSGVRTTIDEFPGIVQIEIGSGIIWSQGCAGSILTYFHVLSAARCFSGIRYSPRFRRVRAGSSTRHDGGVIVYVDNAINHPNFQSGANDADITIVRLSTNLNLSSTIQQTSIVPQGFNFPAGLSVSVVGWGSTAQGRLITNRELYQITLATVDSSSCQDRWSRIITITDRMICVADPQFGGRNGDIRDSGAPLYYQGILAGVVSLGIPVGNQRFPVIATSIGSFTNWIVATAV